MSNGFTYSVERPRNGAASPRRARVQLTPEAEMKESGTIKWFDTDRRFGFIIPERGGQDVFLHASVASKYGLRGIDLQKDVIVRFVSERRPGLRPEATAVALA